MEKKSRYNDLNLLIYQGYLHAAYLGQKSIMRPVLKGTPNLMKYYWDFNVISQDDHILFVMAMAPVPNWHLAGFSFPKHLQQKNKSSTNPILNIRGIQQDPHYTGISVGEHAESL